MKLTDDEQAYLLRQPEVVEALERFNRALIHQTADEAKRFDLLSRVRLLERMTRRAT